MLSGVFRSPMAPIALAAALMVYLAFPGGRIVGIVLDGMPSGSVIGALAFDISIAGLLLAAFKPTRIAGASREQVVDLPG